jgi:hypothetical protein
MGGRQLPVECDHGVIVDWGDFGPDPENGQEGARNCPICTPGPGRCSVHGTVLVQRFRIDGKWFMPTDTYYCVPCADERREALDELSAESARLGLER